MKKTPKRSKNTLFAVLLLGCIGGIQTADPIISSVALVRASETLHFSASVTALASSISTLALAATVIASGLLADRIGRRRLLMLALVTTIAGDLLVATSTNAPLYLLGRVIAGIGLGAVFSAAFAYVRAVAGDRIGPALGQFGAMGGITTMLGGLVGGILVTTSWRLAYLVVPALCLLGFLLVPVMLPKVPKVRAARLDIAGLVLLALGTIGILYGVSQASSHLTAPTTWLPIVAGLVALVLFVIVEKHSSHAVFPIKLFKSPVFLAAALTVLVWNFAQAVAVLQLSNLWQYVERYTPTMVTFGQLPLSIIAILGSIVAGRRLAKGQAPRAQIIFGFGLVALGFVSLAILPLSSAYWLYLPALLLIGFGLPFAVVPSGQLFMSEAPAKSFGPVTSSKTTIGQFGYALGLAGSMVLVDNVTTGGLVNRLIKAGVPPSQTGQSLDAVTAYMNTSTPATTELSHQALHLASNSYTQAFSMAMLIAAIVTATAGILAYLLLARQARNVNLIK